MRSRSPLTGGSPRCTGPLGVGLLAVTLMTASTTSLPAQVVRGTVVDAVTDRPVPGANLTLLTFMQEPARRLMSDSLGRFEVEVPLSGRYMLEAERLGYQTTLSPPFDVLPLDTLTVILRMGVDAVELAPLEVVGSREVLTLDPRLASWGYYDRRVMFENGTGVAHFLDYDEIQRRNPARATDLLQQMAGVHLSSRGGSRGPAVLGARRCHLTLYLNGVKFRLYGGGIDDFVLASSIVAVEVYPRAPYPVQYSPDNPRCGSIVIWTGWVDGKGKGG